jgi:hypothetical protein
MDDLALRDAGSDACLHGPLENATEPLGAPALPYPCQRGMIGQPFLQAVPGEPADRQIDLRLAQEPPVVDDAEQEAGQHQPDRRLRRYTRPPDSLAHRARQLRPAARTDPTPDRRAPGHDRPGRDHAASRRQRTRVVAAPAVPAFRASPWTLLKPRESRTGCFFNSPTDEHCRPASAPSAGEAPVEALARLGHVAQERRRREARTVAGGERIAERDGRAAPRMSSQAKGPPDHGMKPQPRIAPTSPSRMSVSTPSSSARTASSVWTKASRCWTSCSAGWPAARASARRGRARGPAACPPRRRRRSRPSPCGRGGRSACSAPARVRRALGIGVAHRVARGPGDLHAEIDRGLVDELQRPEREAELAGGVLDQRRRHALGHHAHALVDVGNDAAVGVEEPGVVDDDRRLADLAHEVERLGDGAVAGLAAADDLDQHHLVDRREEVDADEPLRAPGRASRAR